MAGQAPWRRFVEAAPGMVRAETCTHADVYRPAFRSLTILIGTSAPANG